MPLAVTANYPLLVLGADIDAATSVERTAALDMIDDNARPGSTVGGDKNYDTADFVAGCRERGAHCMSRRTIPTAARRSMRAQLAIPAMRSA